MPRPQLNLRDLFWLVLVVALAVSLAIANLNASRVRKSPPPKPLSPKSKPRDTSQHSPSAPTKFSTTACG
jgi:hypothetical protein